MITKGMLITIAWSLSFIVAAQETEVGFREPDPFGADPDPFQHNPDWTFYELKDQFKAEKFVITAFRINRNSGSVEILATETADKKKHWIIFRPGQAYRNLKLATIDSKPVTLKTESGAEAATVATKVIFEMLDSDPPSFLVLSDLIEPNATIEKNQQRANKGADSTGFQPASRP